MQFLVIFNNKPEFATDGPPADFAERMADDAARLKELYAEGSLRQVWALDTKTKGAAVLFEADSPAGLQKMIDTFPLIKVDYADYQIWPLAPYPAFARQP